MNKIKRLKAFAVVATLYTAVGTGDIAYSRAPEGFEIPLLILAIIILDGGFWLLDSLVPEAKSRTHRNVISGALGLWWVMMTVSNLASAYQNAISANSKLSGWGLLAVGILAVIALLFLVVYIALRYTDPEMKMKLLELEEDYADQQAALELYRKERQKARGAHSVTVVQARMEEEGRNKYGITPSQNGKHETSPKAKARY